MRYQAIRSKVSLLTIPAISTNTPILLVKTWQPLKICICSRCSVWLLLLQAPAAAPPRVPVLAAARSATQPQKAAHPLQQPVQGSSHLQAAQHHLQPSQPLQVAKQPLQSVQQPLLYSANALPSAPAGFFSGHQTANQVFQAPIVYSTLRLGFGFRFGEVVLHIIHLMECSGDRNWFSWSSQTC